MFVFVFVFACLFEFLSFCVLGDGCMGVGAWEARRAPRGGIGKEAA